GLPGSGPGSRSGPGDGRLRAPRRAGCGPARAGGRGGGPLAGPGARRPGAGRGGGAARGARMARGGANSGGSALSLRWVGCGSGPVGLGLHRGALFRSGLPRPDRGMGGGGMSARVMAVWCPDWPAVAAARAEGHGLHLPLAVVGPRGVLACNAVARAVGVRRGLRRREAQFRCPDLVVVAADEARDAAWFEPVVQALDAVVPGIEVLRPGLFVFSADGALRFHGGVEEVGTRVADAVAAAGVECQVGLADELPTAVLAARGSALLEPGTDAGYLADLPVGALVLEPALGDPGVLSELVGLLRRLGVRTIGDFA